MVLVDRSREKEEGQQGRRGSGEGVVGKIFVMVELYYITI